MGNYLIRVTPPPSAPPLFSSANPPERGKVRGGRGSYGPLDNRGVTLTELLVVISIISVLTVALGFSYVGWMGGYKIEKEIKTLQTAMVDARTRAMQLNRIYFFDISSNGRFYRFSQDDSNGTAKVADGDGVLQAQATWATIQASSPVSWGTVAATKDTTVTELSRKIELTNTPQTVWVSRNSSKHSGLLIGWWYVYPAHGYTFRLGFDKRGIIRNMTWGALNIESATVPFNPYYPATPSWGPEVSICIFTDYDGNGVSDYNPDYDCINIMETKISLGKLTTQNTAGGDCVPSNCLSK